MQLDEVKEARRLDSLASLEILDTAPEETYDRITKLCCRVFDVPIAGISLVDKDRVWFKSIKGWRKREFPRGDALCDHTIRRGSPLVIEDALADARTKTKSFVVGKPHIRFYAGIPLVLSSNDRVGALCLFDTRPRKLLPNQFIAMQRISDIVGRKMELRAAVKRLFWDIEERLEAESFA